LDFGMEAQAVANVRKSRGRGIVRVPCQEEDLSVTDDFIVIEQSGTLPVSFGCFHQQVKSVH